MIAYAKNKDPDAQYPMINFCQAFFFYPSLSDAYRNAQNHGMRGNLDLTNYINRGILFLVRGLRIAHYSTDQ